MGKELFEERKKFFKDYVIKEKRLPRYWEMTFADGQDLRQWFDSIVNTNQFDDYIKEIKDVLSLYGLKLLTDEEKEQTYLEYIALKGQMPLYREAYFEDNEDMNVWFSHYRKVNPDFERTIIDSNIDYRAFELEEIWFAIRDDYVKALKSMNRIPSVGELRVPQGIDARIIFDKLTIERPKEAEEIRMQIYGSKKSALTIENRIKEFIAEVKKLGYIPELQEKRFSDKIDMFTWYTIAKDRIPGLEEKVNSLVQKNTIKKINIYFIPEFRKTGGKFYRIVSNEGEVLDVSNLTSLEEAKKVDSTFNTRGGIILKADEEIDSDNVFGGKGKK